MQVDQEHLVGVITGHIRRLKPEVVVTFDPDGGYGHPDHIAIHDATVAAFTAASDPERYPEQGESFQPQKLYFLTISMRVMKLLVPLVKLVGRDPTRWGRNRDIDLTEVFAERYPVHARINYRRAASIKRRAINCHASQLQISPEGDNRLIQLLYRINRLDTVESFMRFHPEPSGARIEPDLFAGIQA